MTEVSKKKWLYWCNECDWEEKMDEHKHDFCPKCGHVNIGRKHSREEGKK
jgi:predicted RNA-binding Zn-ribbon protein involved in translation (DUF1610 family)